MATLHVRCVTPLSAAVLAWFLPAVAAVTSKNFVVRAKQGFDTPGAAPASVTADAPAPAPAKPCFKKMPLKAQEQGFDGKMVIHQDGQSHTSDWMKEYGANVTKSQKPAKQELSDAEKASLQKPEKTEEEAKTQGKSETPDKKEKEDNKPSSVLEPLEDLKPAVPTMPTVPIPGVKSLGIRAIANLWAIVAVAAASFHMC